MFQPLHDYVLVERTEAAEKTDGGLYLPQISREKTQEDCPSSLLTQN